MTSTVVLWIYIAFLVAGGLVGFLKAGSKASLITSAVFGGLIALSAVRLLPLMVATILIGFLAVFFGMRFAKGKKFMPAGLMVFLSVAALLALLVLS